MKKFVPFLFPLAALAIVLFLAYRWYSLRTNRPTPDVAQFGEGVEIENLTAQDRSTMRAGARDLTTVTLAPEANATGSGEISGSVRYAVDNDRVLVSVNMDAPAPMANRTQTYQVWFKAQNATTPQRAFTLTYGKGGYMGDAAISADNLPLEVMVSQERQDDNQIEAVLLKGMIQAPQSGT